MKVSISVGGRWHAFHLARELDRKGYLEKLFTSYPRFTLKDTDIAGDKVDCLILKEILERVLYKMPYPKNKTGVSYYMADVFDRQVSSRIKPCDIFVGWSSFSLHTLRKIKKSFFSKTILERGSIHIKDQRDIYLAEAKRLGVNLLSPCRKVVEKELAEYREADYIAVPSTLAKESFLKRGLPENKIICVPLGVDTEVFRPIPKNDRIFRIISVGLSIRKGIHLFLQAVNELRIKDLEVWLIGEIDNEAKHFLKKYPGNVKYLGGLPQRELYKYYSQGSVSILFSLEDGFGMVLSEAMACGLPVICSSGVGAKDVVREGIDGFVLPIGDVERLKEKIVYLYEHREKAKAMGQEARKRVESDFTWGHYGERIIDNYRKILSREEISN